MDGLFFLMSIVGVGLVMWWVVRNDRVAPDQPTTGLFAMVETVTRRSRAHRSKPGPQPDQPAAKPPPRRRRRAP